MNQFSADILKALLETHSDAIVICDTEDRVLRVNPAFEQLFGWKAEEITGLVLPTIPEQYNTLYLEQPEQLRDGQPITNLITKRVRKDGTLVDVSVTSTPIEDQNGTVVAFMVIYRDISQQILTEKRLHEKEQRYASLVTQNSDAIFTLDLQAVVQNTNPTVERLFGYKAEQLRDKPMTTLISPKDRPKIISLFNRAKEGQTEEFELNIQQSRGKLIDCLIKFVPIVVEEQVVGVYGIAKDISMEKRMYRAIRESEERYKRLLDHSPSAMFIHADGFIQYANKAAAKLLKYSYPDQLIGKSIYNFHPLTEREKVKKDNELFYSRKKEKGTQEEKVIAIDGTEVDVEVYKILTRFRGRRAIHSIVIDMSERKQYEEKIHQLAYYDTLTGLPNRTLFHDRVQQAFARARRLETSVAIMYLDCDDFKSINDRFGHDAGDEFLQMLGDRLSRCLRAADTIARIGGDEFNVLLQDVQSIDEVQTVATRILSAIQEPWVYNGHEFNVTLSIGIALYPQHGTEKEEIVKKADRALYTAKEKGKNNYFIYSE